MIDVEALLRPTGGIALVGDLRFTASEHRAFARAAERGLVLRVRAGVYAMPELHDDLLRAARVGGRVAGLSALEHHGLWVPPRATATLHVEVGDSMRIRRTAGGSSVSVHWMPATTRPRFTVAPLDAVLAGAATELPRPHAVAVLDSVLRRTPLTALDLRFLSQHWRPGARAAAALADGRAESGTESIIRVVLRGAGIHATPQARLPISDLARADLLIGDRLVIECDSEAHHSDPASRRADLERDALLMSLGFIVLRIDYQRAVRHPEQVVAEVAAIVQRGDHLSGWRGPSPEAGRVAPMPPRVNP
ncbi:DUF559 domain-containing protein [Microcella daejeonensis]|uniref:DUF559 domain-containing protein n=1 Tax=Microcella daejeonensis TaxID=2994971 RepID=UPI002270434A|nr:DUF559 domain-containing protein [Microcella daejeonensis]WAB83680.1 DUF559 domain-containing protein [Microcella daejeonensis]